MKLMGAKVLFLSNAAVGMNDDYYIGDLMILIDHISFFVESALRGKNIDEFGVLFPDISQIYTKEYIDLIRDIAKRQ